MLDVKSVLVEPWTPCQPKKKNCYDVKCKKGILTEPLYTYQMSAISCVSHSTFCLVV